MSARVSPDAIDRDLRSHRLVHAYRAVYYTSHGTRSLKTRALASVLACGERAMASNAIAGSLWAMLPEPEGDVAMQVTVAARGPDGHPGIELHRSLELLRRDVRRVDGIPVTSPARTLLDIAATESRDTLERALDEALFARTVRLAQIRELLQRVPGRRGTRRLRILAETELGDERSRREAERRLYSLVRAAGLTPVRRNARVGRHTVDLLWPGHRQVVEMDSYAHHRRRRSFEADRSRDAELIAAGYRVIRVTWRQVTQTPETVVARISAALALASV